MLKTMPNADKLEKGFKDKFIKRYSRLTDWGEFKKYSLAFLRKGIRVNTLKISISDLKKRLSKNWKLEQVPWCKEGFFISGERRDVGNLPEHVLGYIYIQEAASMIPPIVLNPKNGETVLDMCASPGSKTTQIGQYLKNTGVLVSNDISGDRLAALGVNVQRCGLMNCIITQMQGRYFKNMEFDKVLVDAPCSGTGTIRKSPKTILMWNPNMVKRISFVQKQLIKTGFENLKKGGTLVYSTCTQEPEENEGVVDYLLSEFDNAKVMPINLKIKRSDAVLEFEGKKYNPQVNNCLRIWPQDNDTEGFFVAKIKKS
ncbi:NOL1/NOP2/sun family putative RNA methylase [Nanoarchaeota archaeon]